MRDEYKSKEEIEFFTCKFSDELRVCGSIDCINWIPTIKYPLWCKIGHSNCIKKERLIIVKRYIQKELNGG